MRTIQQQLLDICVAAVTACSDEVAMKARGRAPVRKERPTGREQGERIVLREPSEFDTAFGKAVSEALTGTEALYGRRELGQRLATSVLRNPKEHARFFRMASGPNKGKSPDLLKFGSRGALKGVVLAEVGGALRDSIKVESVSVVGKRVIGTVATRLPYAAAMEEGFYHHPDRRFIAGRSYMRLSLEEVRQAWESGAYFRGKR